MEAANAFRQTEKVKELARILVHIPIREYQLAAQYHLVLCKCREMEYRSDILEGIVEQSQTYKAKALITRAAFEVYQGKPETAFYFYTEALRANPTVPDFIMASTGIASVKSMEGFNGSALKDLEDLVPLLPHADLLTHSLALNAYAVELTENERFTEAHGASLVAVRSPFAPFYPELQDTLSQIRSRRKRRSTVVFSRALIERQYEAEGELEIQENPIDKARVQAVIDFMKDNLHRNIALTELAAVVNLSPSHFSYLFRTQIGTSPGEYLIKLRMEKARQLLATGFLSVKQIMVSVGYSTRSNFLRHFKRYFGVAPYEYRKRFFAGIDRGVEGG